MQGTTALCDATLFTGEAFVEGHALLIKDGKVLDIVARSKVSNDAAITSYKDKILTPGFIDAQVNGGGNVMLNNEPTEAACLAIVKVHRRYGTTRLLPTVISDSFDVTQKAVAAVRAARKKDQGILGIHIEGPHLGEQRRGVHKAEHLRGITDEDFKLYHRDGNEIMMMTVAPESVSPEQIKKLRAQGVIVSIGHTQASAEQTRAALAAGATGFTHLYNGMNKSVEPESGPAAVALSDRNSWCSIIADGYHVSPEMIQLALRAKPEKVFLVSDAMPPSGTDNPQPFSLYGEIIHSDDGRCVNNEGKLAGAILTIAQAVKNCIDKFGIEPAEALRMGSLYPARFLGLDAKLGKLLPGYEADVVAMDHEFKISTVTSFLK
jgi:N-acetylglucosamine-6-phosphate deacetylase